jgi:asparagine synthase (glutamine-hydrolysing)
VVLRPPFTSLSEDAADGPDDPHLFFDPFVAQARSAPGARLVGEMRIDNAAELSRQLDLDSGPVADEAAIFLHAFRRWGLDCFDRIEGDFAVAIWDHAEDRLILARDAIGQRPLHYRELGRGVAFTSLPIGLAALAGPPRADLVQMVSRLAFMPHIGERSFIEGVKRVQPGHAVIASSGGGIVEKLWWQPDLSPLHIGHGDAVDAVSEQLGTTMRAMLRSDAPAIAADLSGGLDSSLVVASAAGVIDDRERLLALTGVAAGPVDCPPRLFANESARAAGTAEMNGVRHRIVEARPESPFAALDRWLPTTQEPVPNACNLGWIDACYAAARTAGADVYLTGGRGNFTVTRPGMARLSDLANAGRLLTLGGELRAYRRFAGGSWPGLLAMSFGRFLPDGVWNRIVPPVRRRRSNPDAMAAILLRDSAAARVAADEVNRHGLDDVGTMFSDERPFARWMVARSLDDGVGNLSVRRRHGLELREPLSARRVVELCLRLPTESYFRDGQPRALARDLLRGKAPASVVDETKRGWQGANWRAGFEPVRQEMAAELDLARDDPQLADVIDVGRARAMLDAWPSGGWNDLGQIGAYRGTLFPVIGAARFARFVREWTPA